MASAVDRAEGIWLNAVGEDDTLRLDAVNPLVPGVHHLLEFAWSRYLPQLPVDEPDEIIEWQAGLDEGLRKLVE